MGKRSNFTRMKGDLYDTPAEALVPVLPFLAEGSRFAEVCAGNGLLIDGLADLRPDLFCVHSSDISPKNGDMRLDALKLEASHVVDADLILTNPPWTRSLLHPMILRCALLRPTWLLFDADWKHTAQASFYLRLCRQIVSVGRVKWIAGSAMTGKENAAWYLFDAQSPPALSSPFTGRV